VRRFFKKLKIKFQEIAGRFFFSILRLAERRLSAQQIFSLLKPFFFWPAVVHTLFRKSRLNAPDFFSSPKNVFSIVRQRQNIYLNHILEFFPERLAEAKWMSRCRLEGFAHLQSALQNGRPVVLAFCHFGPFFLLRFWLRAAGLPAAMFIGGNSDRRTRLMRLKDRCSPSPKIPIAFYQNQLREAVEFIAAGNPLLMPIDALNGRQMMIPFSDGWDFQMATGAVRLAIRQQAELISCSIIDEGGWHFRIKFGRPVPKEFLIANVDWSRAGKHLLDEMIPDFQARPEQCLANLTGCLKKKHEQGSEL
jgi:lauroyl/myristoyl acyltransferase